MFWEFVESTEDLTVSEEVLVFYNDVDGYYWRAVVDSFEESGVLIRWCDDSKLTKLIPNMYTRDWIRKIDRKKMMTDNKVGQGGVVRQRRRRASGGGGGRKSLNLKKESVRFTEQQNYNGSSE